MEQFTITIYQPTAVVEQVATILGWDSTAEGALTARDFVANALSPKVKDAIANIMLEPAKQAQQAVVKEAINKAEEDRKALEAMKPQLLEAIDIKAKPTE